MASPIEAPCTCIHAPLNRAAKQGKLFLSLVRRGSKFQARSRQASREVKPQTRLILASGHGRHMWGSGFGDDPPAVTKNPCPGGQARVGISAGTMRNPARLRWAALLHRMSLGGFPNWNLQGRPGQLKRGNKFGGCGRDLLRGKMKFGPRAPPPHQKLLNMP